jgi:predicted enzyme related to lactoylglutathione lyase
MSLCRHILTIFATDDLPRSVKFYAQAFGWKKIVDVPVYAEFELQGGMRLGLYERKSFALNTGQVPFIIPEGALTPTELYFHSDDLEGDIEKILKAGARQLSELKSRDWGDEAAYFADPDGNVIVLARKAGENEKTEIPDNSSART